MGRSVSSGRPTPRLIARSARMSLILQQQWLAYFRVGITMGIGLPSRTQPTISIWSSVTWTPVVPVDAYCFTAVRRGDVRALQKGFSTGNFGVYDIMPNGSSLLHVAVQCNHFEVVAMLLEQGAKVNVTNDVGDTALHEAVKYAVDLVIVDVLLRHGADILLCNRFGKTPLHTFFNGISRELLMRNLEYLDVNAIDDRGMTIAHYVAWTRESTIQDFNKVMTAELSLQTDGFDRSFLHLAAQRGNVALVAELCKALKEHGFPRPDVFGRGVQHYGAESSRAPQVIDVLVANGFHLSAHDRAGRTVLDYAAFCDNTKAIKYLTKMSKINTNGVPSHRDPDGEISHSSAEQANDSRVVEDLSQPSSLSLEVNQSQGSPVTHPESDMHDEIYLYDLLMLDQRICTIFTKLLLPCLLALAAFAYR